MATTEKNSWFAPIIFVGILTVVFTAMYYLSSNPYKQSQGRSEFDYAGRPTQQVTNPDQLILGKNERRVVGKNAYIFRGLEGNVILLDFFLLEMDPEQPYEKRFSKKAAKKTMELGQNRYRLLSVNDRHLILKKLDTK